MSRESFRLLAAFSFAPDEVAKVAMCGDEVEGILKHGNASTNENDRRLRVNGLAIRKREIKVKGTLKHFLRAETYSTYASIF